MAKNIEQFLNKIIYIPLEIIDREIDGALLLSFEAISRGWSVIIGSQRKITENIESNEKGIYFLKSVTPGQVNLQKRIVNAGNLIFSQDAEGLLQRPGLEYKMRFSNDSLQLVEKVFLWGERQKLHFLEAFGKEFEQKCEITGSPRADHWELINQDKDRNPDPKYILIATSFGNQNHVLGEDGQYNLSKAEAGVKIGANSLEEFNKYFNCIYKLEMFLLPYYKKLVLELSKKYPNEKIILRPHPSESLMMWQDLVLPLDNVEIRTDRSIVDWLNQSKVLIQYGSTCSIQSNILNVPTVTLIPNLPKELKKYDLEDSRKASYVYEDLDVLIQDFDKFIKKDKYLKPIDDKHINELIFSRKKLNSSKNIMDSVEKIYEKNKTVKVIKDRTKIEYYLSIFKQNIVLLASLIPFWKKIAPKRYRHLSLKSFLYYKRRKQPSQTLDEFKMRIDSLKKLSSFDKKIIIKKYKKDVFLLNSN